MGLLTDPSAGQGKIIKLLLRFYPKLCVFLYLGGMAYFAVLAARAFNNGTYISENALLPGLVSTEFYDSDAKKFHAELLDEMKAYDTGIPYPWLLAKFRQMGLDTYTHNFTLEYPLGAHHSFTGKNVYGILRAARAASTEALVLTVPYRPPTSVHLGTAPSIAIMLSFAQFAVDKKYWAKDIIFLVTEHEQLGMQAWLEAYHGVSCGRRDVLRAGEMKGRAGAIQAAINLEFHAAELGHIDLKIEGLNGQLPNLDLFNLVTKLANKEDIRNTFKGRLTNSKKFRDDVAEWMDSMPTLLSMMATQAPGIPNGNHGLLYRFGIQAITLEGFAPTSIKQARITFVNQGFLLESVFRSLNNLLERFHQSYFFYLLPASDRYISIGFYMPAIGVIAAATFIKSYAKWCQLHEDTAEQQKKEKDKDKEVRKLAKKESPKFKLYEKMSLSEWQMAFDKTIAAEAADSGDGINLGYVGLVVALTHCLGFSLKDMPDYFANVGLTYGLSTELSIYVGLGVVTILTILAPIIIPISCEKSMGILSVLALLELGTTLVCIAMYNISLAMFLGGIYVPLVLVINPSSCSYCNIVQRVFWLIGHPFVLLNVTVVVYTYFCFPADSVIDILNRGIKASQTALTFSVVDSIIYGNWMYNLVTSVCLSNWICFWFVCWTKVSPIKTDLEDSKKNN